MVDSSKSSVAKVMIVKLQKSSFAKGALVIEALRFEVVKKK